MTPITKTDVTNFATQLANIAPGGWEDILAFVNQFNLTTMDSDDDRKQARIYLAAHIVQSLKEAKTGAAGPVTSSAAGDVRRSYGLIASMASAGALGTTKYGQLFQMVLGFSACAGPLVG
jgi:hypothetical protein